MNEDLSIKKRGSENFGKTKKSKTKKTGKKKKNNLLSKSRNEIEKNSQKNLLEDKLDKIFVEKLNQKISSDSKITKKSSESDEKDNSNSSSAFLKNFSENSKSSDQSNVLTDNNNNEKEKTSSAIISSHNTNPPITDNIKMSWRKLPTQESNKKKKELSGNEVILPINSSSKNNQEETYVTDLVKNLLNQIILDGEKNNNKQDKINENEKPEIYTLTVDNETSSNSNKNCNENPINNSNSYKKQYKNEGNKKICTGNAKNQKKIKIGSKRFDDTIKTQPLYSEQQINPSTSKSYNSDNECLIECTNHKITRNREFLPNMKVMIDNYSQTSSQTNTDDPMRFSNNFQSTNPDEFKMEENSNNLLENINSQNSNKSSKKKNPNNFRENVNLNEIKNPIKFPTSTNMLNSLNQNSSVLELKKCTSDGYKINNFKNINENQNQRTGSINNSYVEQINKKYQIYDRDKEVQAEETFHKNSNGYLNSYNSKRTKYYPNYYVSKFNNSENGNFMNKQISNRPFYSRPEAFYNCQNTYGIKTPSGVLGNMNSSNINSSLFRNNFNFNSSNQSPIKDPSNIYNNYYIINSNVNINPAYGVPETNDSYNCNKNYTISNNFYNYVNQDSFVYNSNTNSSIAGIFNYNSKINQNDDVSNKINILKKIDDDIYPFIFHYRLHNDILDYSDKVTEAISYLKEIKLSIIKYLEIQIKKALGCEMTIDLYGSFATDLSIECSDIDMTIKFAEEKDEVEIETIINKLCEYFEKMEIFEKINPIYKASVPVIKILIDPMKILDQDSEEIKKYKKLINCNFFKNHKFDIEELLKVKVDLTFIEVQKTNCIPDSTKKCLDWAKNTLELYPEIKPIIHVLKRYLQIKKLNSSFNGGLSSFSLFLLLVAYLKSPKIKTRINLGRILMEMLELYGKYFPYAHSVIDVNSINPFNFTNEYLENIPVILDPVTGLNVAKSSFRIEQVRESFSEAYDFFNKIKILFDKKDLSNSKNVVIDMILNTNIKSNLSS